VEGLKKALTPLKRSFVKKFFVSGVHQDKSLISMLMQQSENVMACCVELGYPASDIIGNACTTAERITKQDYESLRLVTVNYYEYRIFLELLRAMPGIEIISHHIFPKPPKNFFGSKNQKQSL
jgi:hypothetical protein